MLPLALSFAFLVPLVPGPGLGSSQGLGRIPRPSSRRCLNTRTRTLPAHIAASTNPPWRSSAYSSNPTIPSITDHASDSSASHPSVSPAPSTAGPCQSVSPHQTPNVAAMALPPRPRKNGENACPSTGASATGTSQKPLIPSTDRPAQTGTAAFTKSRSIAGTPTTQPPTLNAFSAPGLWSPVMRGSRPLSRASQTEKRSDPEMNPAAVMHRVFSTHFLVGQ